MTVPLWTVPLCHCVTVCHCVSLCVTVCHCVSLCVIVCVTVCVWKCMCLDTDICAYVNTVRGREDIQAGRGRRHTEKQTQRDKERE